MLQKILFQRFAINHDQIFKNVPRINYKSIMHRSGDGSKKRKEIRNCFSIFPTEHVLKKTPTRRARKSESVLFSNLDFMAHERRPMELRSDFQEHFALIFKRFKDNFVFFSNGSKAHQRNRSEKRSESQGARPTNNNFFHNKAGCPSAVAGLGEALWIKNDFCEELVSAILSIGKPGFWSPLRLHFE